MPGSVSNAAPSTVLPESLCVQFTHAREYPVNENDYKNGESQRGRLADTSRKSWKTSRRLPPTTLATFRAFYEARDGQTEPFYFYEPTETVPKHSHDPTGVDTNGRYTVRFASPWEQMVMPGRSEFSIELVELA